MSRVMILNFSGFRFLFLVQRGGLIGSRVCMAYGLASRVQGFGS